MSDEGKKVNVRFPEGLQAGVYANMMAVAHTREEFIMDFIMMAPPGGTVTARVVCSPGHVKRIVAALQENLKKYESAFGAVKVAEEPPGQIGFTRQ